MDREKLFKWSAAGAAFSIVASTLLHFLYQWSGENFIIGLISPVNESVWEHLKLSFYPILIFALIERAAIGRDYPNILYYRMVGLIIGLITVVSVFYTYTGIIGRHFLVADISLQFLAILAEFYIGYRLVLRDKAPSKCKQISVALVIIALASAFTFF